MNNIQNRNQKTRLQDQMVGLEIEMTGAYRESVAEGMGRLLGTERVRFVGGTYDKWVVRDADDRKWTVMSDGSVTEQPESVELVTPLLSYDEALRMVPAICGMVKELGCYTDESCGIHIHVSDAELSETPQTIGTLLRLAVGRENLIYEALEIDPERANWWCFKTVDSVAENIYNSKDMNDVWDAWYTYENRAGRWSGYNDREEHYNPTRYHGINLHSLYQNKGVEFRYFNGTLDSSRIIAYIQFICAIHSFALNCSGLPIKFHDEEKNGYSQSRKKTLFRGFLTKRLGMSGAEFAVARKILCSAF